ncbi:hypothetical protein CsSME_00011620 [Camellia sinensis var. sinensis]
MNTHLLDSANLFWSSSSFLTSTTRSTKVLTKPKNPASPLLLIKQRRRDHKILHKASRGSPRRTSLVF